MDDDKDVSDQPKYLTHDDLNNALSNREKRLLKQMQEMLSQHAPKKAEPEVEVETKLTLKALQERLDRAEKEKQEEKKLNLKYKLDTNLKDALSELGVDSKLMKHALKYLDGVVGYNDEEKLIFKSEDQEFELKEGLKQWSKTEDAKFYLPAKNIKGAGTSKPFGNATTSSEVAGAEEILGALFGK